jgi:hypothetical protein
MILAEPRLYKKGLTYIHLNYTVVLCNEKSSDTGGLICVHLLEVLLKLLNNRSFLCSWLTVLLALISVSLILITNRVT